TWHAIKDKTHLHAPTDSDPLLQQVYEGATPPGLDAELARELEDAHASHQRHQAELEARLRDVRMPPPEAFFDKLPPEKLPADELGAVTHASTRLGRESLTVIPLNEQPDGSLVSLNGVTLQSLAHEPNMREAELMSEAHLAIRNPHLLSSMRDKGVICPWKENPHLRFAAPL